MPNSPAFDLSQYLLDVSPKIVTTNRTSGTLPIISVGMEPNIDRRTLVTIYDTGGPAANPAYQRDYPRIQIRSKAADEFGYSGAFNIQQVIKDILLGMSRVTINDTLYVGVWQQTEIATLAADYNNRPILICNYRMVREYETSNRLPIV